MLTVPRQIRLPLVPISKRFKLLHVASGDRWAGAEVQVCTLLTELRKNASLDIYAVILNEGELSQRLMDGGVKVTVLNEDRLGSFTIMREMLRLLKAIRPDVVHSHRQKENVLVSVANFFATRSPCVRTVHGAPEHPVSVRHIGKYLAQLADSMCGKYLQQRVIAVSEELGTQLRQHFPPASVIVVKNGVNYDAIEQNAAVPEFRKAQPDAIHIGFVGRLEAVKRVDLFIDMALCVVKNHAEQQFCFHIFGDGQLREQLESQHSRTTLGNALQFHGHRSDIATCIAGLDVLVMCSDHEGTPMTLLEAITLGTPVVAHHIGGLAELLADESGGVLVRQHDAVGYADAVVSLLNNPQRLHELIEAGQRHIREHYSAAANASQMLSIYMDLLDTRR